MRNRSVRGYINFMPTHQCQLLNYRMSPNDTLTQTMISTARSLVVILHTELGVRIGETVPRRAAITSTGVL